MIKIPLASLALRGISMVSRFVLIVMLGKWLAIDDFGVFGLVQSGIFLGIYALGLEAYIFIGREISGRDVEKSVSLIRSQFAIVLVAYVVITPIIFLVILLFVPLQIAYVFCFILVFEHFTLEVSRTLAALHRPIDSSFIWVVRSVPWIWPLLAVGWLWPEVVTLDVVLNAWSAGLAAAAAVAAALLRWRGFRPMFARDVDVAIMSQALKVGTLFLVAVLANRLASQSARFFLAGFQSAAEVGVFSFFQNLTMLLEVVITAGIVVVYYPKILYEKKNQNENGYDAYLKQFRVNILYVTAFFVIAMFVSIKPLIAMIDKPELLSYLAEFYILVVATAIMGVGAIFHYHLLIDRRERWIVAASCLGAVVNLAGNFVLVPALGIRGAVVSLAVSTCLVVGIEAWRCRNPVSQMSVEKP